MTLLYHTISSIETNTTIGDVLRAYNNVEKWTQPEAPSFSMNFFAMKPKVHKVPKGVVLNIVPFNYPLWLSIGPIAGALAAGNAILVKLPESTPAVSSLIAELMPNYLDRDLVRVVNGAVAETTKVLELQWDHSTHDDLMPHFAVTNDAVEFSTLVAAGLGGLSQQLLRSISLQ